MGVGILLRVDEALLRILEGYETGVSSFSGEALGTRSISMIAEDGGEEGRRREGEEDSLLPSPISSFSFFALRW